MISFSLRSISIHSLAFHPEKLVCFCKLIKIDFPHIFPVLLFVLVFRVKVESSVDIFRAFSFTCFSFSLFFPQLSCVLLLIQTERTIHYKSLFYNERHSFQDSRVKAHTAEKRRKFEWGGKWVRNYTKKALAGNHHSRRNSDEEKRNYTNSKLLWKLVCKWKFESKKWNGNENGRISHKGERNGERKEKPNTIGGKHSE